MIEKLTQFVVVLFDGTLSAVKSVLWMLIVVILAVLVITTGFVAMIAQIVQQ